MYNKNLVILGDNYEKTIQHLEKGSVQLLSTDPLWNTGKKWLAADDEGTIGSYDDTFISLETYLLYLYKRVVLWREYLAPNGIMALHVDSDYSPYIRVEVMDRAFSKTQYLNTVVWSYRRWSASSKKFNKLHQDIIIYKNCIDKSYTFNDTRVTLDKPRKRNLVAGRKPMRDEKGDVVYKMQTDRLIGDVWDDILPVPNKGGERVDYPTQKPLAIAERLINTFTEPEDLVFDPHAGSGTTALAASLCNRSFITIDHEQTAFDKTVDRLKGAGIAFKAINGTAINVKGVKDMSDFEYQKHIIEALGGVVGPRGADGGIDGEIPGTSTAIAVTRSTNCVNKMKKFFASMCFEGYTEGIMVSPKNETTASRACRDALTLKNDKIHITFMSEENVLGKEDPKVELYIEGFVVKALVSGFRNPIVNYSWFINEDSDNMYLFGLGKPRIIQKENRTGIKDFSGFVKSGEIHDIRCVVADSKGQTAVVELSYKF